MRAWLVCATVLLLISATARGEVMFDNGAPPPLSSFAYSMTESVQAEDFELIQTSVITEIRFYTLERLISGQPIGYSGSIWWSIRQDENGTPSVNALAGEETQDVSRVFTGVLNDNYKAGAQAINSIEIDPLSLSPGHYWLLLHNGPLGHIVSAQGFLLWEGPEVVQGANGLHDATPFDGSWNETFGDRAFSLIGVPEPSGVCWIIALGLLGQRKVRGNSEVSFSVEPRNL